MTPPEGSEPATSRFLELGSKRWRDAKALERRKQSFPSFHAVAKAGQGLRQDHVEERFFENKFGLEKTVEAKILVHLKRRC